MAEIVLGAILAFGVSVLIGSIFYLVWDGFSR